jgi:hypothetical protein
MEWKFYSGELSLGVDTLAVIFRAGADASGEIEFEPIKLDHESKFIFLKWHDDSNDGMTYFNLSCRRRHPLRNCASQLQQPWQVFERVRHNHAPRRPLLQSRHHL